MQFSFVCLLVFFMLEKSLFHVLKNHLKCRTDLCQLNQNNINNKRSFGQCYGLFAFACLFVFGCLFLFVSLINGSDSSPRFDGISVNPVMQARQLCSQHPTDYQRRLGFNTKLLVSVSSVCIRTVCHHIFLTFCSHTTSLGRCTLLTLLC